MPKVSNRSDQMPSSPIRKLTPYATAASRKGVKIYHLNIGQPDIPTPEKALDAVRHIKRKTLEYTMSQGLLSLRSRLCGYYAKFGIRLSSDDIIVTTGGSEALNTAMLSCLDLGDEVIIPEPAYANYMSFAQSAGVVVKTVTSTIETGFALPPIEEFEKQITPKTRAILLCNPNNPTGYLYTAEELEQLRQIVLKYDLFLICDEVYREFVYNGQPFVSALTLEGIENNVVLVDSVSKRYSECGIRIGMIVTRNEALREVIMKFCQARLSPPLLGQIVAENSIDGTEEYQRKVYQEYKDRRDFLIEGLNKIPGVYTPTPEGAFYTVAKLPVDNAEDFCKWCLTDFVYTGNIPLGLNHYNLPYIGETVMMAPAAGFYVTEGLGVDEVRMAYVLNKQQLGRALVALENALSEYNKR